MCKSRFTEDEIVAIPKENEAGTPTRELARRQGPLYNWRPLSGRLKALEMLPPHSDTLAPPGYKLLNLLSTSGVSSAGQLVLLDS